MGNMLVNVVMLLIGTTFIVYCFICLFAAIKCFPSVQCTYQDSADWFMALSFKHLF